MVSIGPFVKDLLLANSPKEIEAVQIKYKLDSQGEDVVQKLRSKFFNPLEIVWFDPSVHNNENKGYAKLLKE
jgi:hypothetical protein